MTNYSELNPAFILFFPIPLLFGLMFGDIGHGICLMGAGLLGAVLFRKNPGTRSFSWIIFYCGIGAIFGGLYGEAVHDIISSKEVVIISMAGNIRRRG